MLPVPYWIVRGLPLYRKELLPLGLNLAWLARKSGKGCFVLEMFTVVQNRNTQV